MTEALSHSTGFFLRSKISLGVGGTYMALLMLTLRQRSEFKLPLIHIINTPDHSIISLPLKLTQAIVYT